MGIFGNSTLPGLRMYTPSSYAIEAAPANAEIGRSFAASFNAAKGRAQDQSQFESRMAQDQSQFDSRMAEEQRRFEQINPAMPAARPDGGGQPASPGVSLPGMMSPGQSQPYTGAGSLNWNGEEKQTWRNYKAKTPQDAIGSIFNAKTVDEAAQIRGANSDWESNPTYRRMADDAFKSPIAREKARNDADSLLIRKQAVDNNTVASKMIVSDATQFNKRAMDIDPESRAEIMALDKNPNGTISKAQWAALGVAEQTAKTRRENERMQAEIEAMQGGGVPTTTITEKGVSKVFRPAKTEDEPADIQPKEMTLSDGSRIVYNKNGAFKLLNPNGNEKELSTSQIQAIAKDLEMSTEPGDNQTSKMLLSYLTSQATNQIARATAPKTTNQAFRATAPKDNSAPVGASSVPMFKWTPGVGLSTNSAATK